MGKSSIDGRYSVAMLPERNHPIFAYLAVEVIDGYTLW
jgi:hypothetical protein